MRKSRIEDIVDIEISLSLPAFYLPMPMCYFGASHFAKFCHLCHGMVAVMLSSWGEKMGYAC